MVSRFNVFAGFFAGLFLISCSSGSDRVGGRNVIGTGLEQNDAGQLQVYEDAGRPYFYSYDENGQRINFIDPVAKSLTFSPELGAAGHAWLATTPDGFAYDVSGSSVQLRTNGLTTATPALKLAGTIISAATDFAQGYVVFVDQFFSIGILQIDAAGQTVASWTGGPVIDGIRTVNAGELIDGGKLVLLVNQSTVVVADLAATIAAKAWQYTQLSLGFRSASWVGRVDGRSDRVMVVDGASIVLLDLTNSTILQTVTGTGSLTPSRNGKDHAFYMSSAGSDLVVIHADTGDTLRENRLKLLDDRAVVTYLTDESLIAATRKRALLKYRLNDGLVLGKYELSGEGRVGLAEDYAVLMYDSALGMLDILDLNSGEKTNFRAFNLPALQND